MKLTKYEHSCMVITKGDSSLVIDPGTYTTPLTDLENVVAIVITHEHVDHWSAEQLDRLLDRNPEVRIFAPAGVVASAMSYKVESVKAGDEVDVEPFSLKFFGEKHAVIHESVPVVDNVAVLVDDTFYYAGDSYTVPDVPVATLAVPVGAPWLKIGDVMDYVAQIAPKQALPVHEAVLSVIGRDMANARVEAVTVAGGGEFFVLGVGESLDL